jgi:hypothetical protein
LRSITQFPLQARQPFANNGVAGTSAQPPLFSAHILSLHGFGPVSFGASVLWIPVTNYDLPRHFPAELLFYETDLVLGGNPRVIR